MKVAAANSNGYIQLLDGIWLKNLVHGETTHMTQVKLGKGAVIPEHSHPHEQTGYLIYGCLRFFSGADETIARTGDSWNVPGGYVHGAEALEDTLVVEVFSPVREDYLGM